MRSYGNTRLAGSASHTPQIFSRRSEARLIAKTRRSQSASAAGGAANRSAITATRPAAHTLRANSTLAITQADHAGADDEYVEFPGARPHHTSATPRANLGMRPLPPVLKRDSAALAGGSRSNAKQP